MPTKSINITNEVYKETQRKYSFIDLIGVLSKEEANELKKYVKETRKRLRKGIEKTARKLQ